MSPYVFALIVMLLIGAGLLFLRARARRMAKLAHAITTHSSGDEALREAASEKLAEPLVEDPEVVAQFVEQFDSAEDAAEVRKLSELPEPERRALVEDAAHGDHRS